MEKYYLYINNAKCSKCGHVTASAKVDYFSKDSCHDAVVGFNVLCEKCNEYIGFTGRENLSDYELEPE